MKRVSLLLCSLLLAVTVEAKKKHNHLDNRGLDEMMCRCEAMYEDMYTRRLDEEVELDDGGIASGVVNYYVIDGIRVLPPSDPACSIDSFRHRKLEVSRVQSD